ncbi:MAG: nuclear transport factor 2 family protein [Bacteroidota bacterium]
MLIQKFYDAFARLDAEAMVSCYHEDIVFYDPAFGELRGDRVRSMWRMLCASQQGKDFRVSYSDIVVNGDQGSARWEAQYTFSKTGRRVHNKIQATFQFQDGLIINHKDDFDLHRWAAQALGWPGRLLGWTGSFKGKLQKQTNQLLENYTEALP